jgi:hypothetical protein
MWRQSGNDWTLISASDSDFARVGRTLLSDALDVDFDSDLDLTLTGKARL